MIKIVIEEGNQTETDLLTIAEAAMGNEEHREVFSKAVELLQAKSKLGKDFAVFLRGRAALLEVLDEGKEKAFYKKLLQETENYIRAYRLGADTTDPRKLASIESFNATKALSHRNIRAAVTAAITSSDNEEAKKQVEIFLRSKFGGSSFSFFANQMVRKQNVKLLEAACTSVYLHGLVRAARDEDGNLIPSWDVEIIDCYQQQPIKFDFVGFFGQMPGQLQKLATSMLLREMELIAENSRNHVVHVMTRRDKETGRQRIWGEAGLSRFEANTGEKISDFDIIPDPTVTRYEKIITDKGDSKMVPVEIDGQTKLALHKYAVAKILARQMRGSLQ